MGKIWKIQMDSLLFPLCFLYYELLFKYFGGLKTGNLSAMIFFVLALGGLAQLICGLLPEGRMRFCYRTAVLALSAVLFLVEYFVGRAFQTFMPFDSLLAGAGDAAGDFSGVIIRTVLHGWYVIAAYFLPLAVFCLYGRKIDAGKNDTEKNNGSRVLEEKKREYGRAAFLLLAAVLCYLSGNYLAQTSPSYRDGYQFDLSARTFGLLTALRLEAVHTLAGEEKRMEFAAEAANNTVEQPVISDSGVKSGRNEMDLEFAASAQPGIDSDIEKLDRFLMTQQGTAKNAYTGLFQGKNLILICAEAFSCYAVDQELTPALYRLVHNGFYFSDYYQPAWGGSTSTGEYSILMGMIPVDGVKSIRETVGHNLYMTIGNQLSRLGYVSAACHNNSYTYYSRNETHPGFGYDIFMGMGNGMEQGVAASWPQSDLEMIDFTVPQYIEHQPFNIYYMTVSGHCGYSFTGNAMSRKNKDAVSGLNASDTVKAYYASQLELEYALESLLFRLEEADILDETVICLTSDHYPYGLEAGDTWGNDRNYLPELYRCEESEIDKFVRDRNTLILWSGCLENELAGMAGEIREPVYSLDILPTLSNLFGVEYDSRLLVGRDVFSDAQPLVIWPDYSWKTDRASYDAQTGEITGEVSDEYVDQIKSTVKNKFNLSRITLENDYWEHLFGEGSQTQTP